MSRWAARGFAANAPHFQTPNILFTRRRNCRPSNSKMARWPWSSARPLRPRPCCNSRAVPADITWDIGKFQVAGDDGHDCGLNAAAVEGVCLDHKYGPPISRLGATRLGEIGPPDR